MSPNEQNEIQITDDLKEQETEPVAKWQPLTRIQRRVAGVLIEKSKTTPDSYPMSINGIKTGANQKSNRSPQMSLQEHEVEDVLYELRHIGAVIEVHSGGRVPKYKHQLYEWLGVEKVELAVLGELLLRGEQTLGDLRARASRMDRIEGLAGLKPIFRSLLEKNLVVELTPPGRGQVVTHNLYLPEELERLQKEFEGHANSTSSEPMNPAPARMASTNSADETVNRLEAEIEQLKQQISQLQQEMREVKELLS